MAGGGGLHRAGCCGLTRMVGNLGARRPILEAAFRYLKDRAPPLDRPVELSETLAVPAELSQELPALVGGPIAEETLWSCTTCGYCEAACPIELEHLDRKSVV